MATLILTAVGTYFGGPIGGSIGSFVGSQIDAAIFKPSGREGPRLKELAVTTSSYGTPIPRHFGTMRSAGSIIWATDLVESREKTGGGKGQPSTTTYSYSSSFAVAIASRPVASVGRVWADGNLLRGAAGDLKVGGTMRFYSGYGDQQPDPLIAAAEGSACPAFRGLAYVVFEDLQLAEFGNRLPALTFEVIAENGDVSLIDLVSGIDREIAIDRPLAMLHGFSDEGGELGNALAIIAQVYPLGSDASAEQLRLFSPDTYAAPLPLLPHPVTDGGQESFGSTTGVSGRSRVGAAQTPGGIRYYDLDRDYQAGLQLAGGRAPAGQSKLIEFPGALAAGDARSLAEMAAKRARSSGDQLNYRIAEIDPGLAPGTVVAIPEKQGAWRIDTWEWREFGLELGLSRLPATATPAIASESGRALPATDAANSPTLLAAYELPWDGYGSPDARQIFAAASASSAGWTGAVLYAEHNGALDALGGSGRERSIIGTTNSDLLASQSTVFARDLTVDVQLASTDFVLQSRSLDDIAQGANRALIGEEIVQFAEAQSLGDGLWRLCGLLRGRGGTENLSQNDVPTGATFVLLDETPIMVEESGVGTSPTLAAIGLADEEPATAPITARERTLRPLSPVHPRMILEGDGSQQFCWTRRSRGAWRWEGTVEPPLIEQSEVYEIGLGSVDSPVLTWLAEEASFTISSADRAQLVADFGSNPLWVRQVGTHARSLPLLLTTLA